jgi:hypothetical protein
MLDRYDLLPILVTEPKWFLPRKTWAKASS